MTIEEAIDRLKLDISLTEFDPSTGDKACLNDYTKQVIEAEKMAISALEKQIPERPVNIIKAEMMEWEFAHCPDCNGSLNHFMNKKFCPVCGKALDWSEKQ